MSLGTRIAGLIIGVVGGVVYVLLGHAPSLTIPFINYVVPQLWIGAAIAVVGLIIFFLPLIGVVGAILLGFGLVVALL